MGILDDAKALWTKLATLVKGDAQKVATALTTTEQKYLPAFEAWAAKQEATLTSQGVSILEDGLTAIGQEFLAGGDVTALISALVVKVLPEVKTDVAADLSSVKADAKNVIYTAIGLAIAALPTTTVANTASSSSGAAA